MKRAQLKEISQVDAFNQTDWKKMKKGNRSFYNVCKSGRKFLKRND